jgi:hypothetical protein
MDTGTYASPTGSYTIDISDRYELDNGQRDTHYDIGKLLLKQSFSPPSAPITIYFDWFEHGTGDYFTKNSYPIDTSIKTNDVPSYDGYSLRDVIDFRPRIGDGGVTFNGANSSFSLLPKRGQDITVDYSYYLARNDKIAIESLDLREPLVVRPTLGLLEMLNMFREGECHLALVSNDPMKALKSIKDGDRPMESASIVGMVTLEDVIEKMIQYDIVDETDVKPNKYPQNSCSSTLLYHNVGKSSKSTNNITKTTNNNSLDDSNIGIVNIHSNDDTDTNDITSTYYQLNS